MIKGKITGDVVVSYETTDAKTGEVLTNHIDLGFVQVKEHEKYFELILTFPNGSSKVVGLIRRTSS